VFGAPGRYPRKQPNETGNAHRLYLKLDLNFHFLNKASARPET
jgi:hypothetical protein